MLATNRNRRVSDFARRVSLYTLAALPADHALASFGDTAVTAGESYEWSLDRLSVRSSAEASRVERVVREVGL